MSAALRLIPWLQLLTSVTALRLPALLQNSLLAQQQPWEHLERSRQQQLQRLGAPRLDGRASAGDRPSRRTAPVRYQHETMQVLVEGAGYPLEEHFVTTADGYVLALYRIPAASAAAAPSSSGGPPVLLQHGLLDSSAAWVLNEPHQSLGFILADVGYDVWLGNSRGNAFSRNHTGFSPASAAFWDFSFDDMAAYDLPAVIDYILRLSEYRRPAMDPYSYM